jgi:hypothetical protein
VIWVSMSGPIIGIGVSLDGGVQRWKSERKEVSKGLNAQSNAPLDSQESCAYLIGFNGVGDAYGRCNDTSIRSEPSVVLIAKV